jgi:NitT/TauT family transport system ATP-binding protein
MAQVDSIINQTMKTERRTAKKAVIELCGVSKDYGDWPFVKEVIADCSFTIERDRITVMIGPSGVGKSTLVRLIAGFEKPTHGEILIDGRPVRGAGHDRLVVFQESALFPWMTTQQNILYGPDARGESGKLMRRQADALLTKVGLRAFTTKYPRQLSGGMQRRAELARAMINDPKVMILDEPFRGLDAMTKGLMLEYYARLHQESNKTTLFVTTDIDEAIFLADSLVIMTDAPMRVRTIIDIDQPHPRALRDIVGSEQINAIKKQALAILHEEAMKSFAGGSKLAADFIEAYKGHSSRSETVVYHEARRTD